MVDDSTAPLTGIDLHGRVCGLVKRPAPPADPATVDYPTRTLRLSEMVHVVTIHANTWLGG